MAKKRKMNSARLTKKLGDNINRCPYCDSDDIEITGHSGDGYDLYCDVMCDGCGEEWTEIYTFRSAVTHAAGEEA